MATSSLPGRAPWRNRVEGPTSSGRKHPSRGETSAGAAGRRPFLAKGPNGWGDQPVGGIASGRTARSKASGPSDRPPHTDPGNSLPMPNRGSQSMKNSPFAICVQCVENSRDTDQMRAGWSRRLWEATACFGSGHRRVASISKLGRVGGLSSGSPGFSAIKIVLLEKQDNGGWRWERFRRPLWAGSPETRVEARGGRASKGVINLRAEAGRLR